MNRGNFEEISRQAKLVKDAGVAELADALDLGSSAYGMGVQVSSPAPYMSH